MITTHRVHLVPDDDQSAISIFSPDLSYTSLDTFSPPTLGLRFSLRLWPWNVLRSYGFPRIVRNRVRTCRRRHLFLLPLLHFVECLLQKVRHQGPVSATHVKNRGRVKLQLLTAGRRLRCRGQPCSICDLLEILPYSLLLALFGYCLAADLVGDVETESRSLRVTFCMIPR